MEKLNKKVVVGAVIGDIVGSRFEFRSNKIKSTKFKLFEKPMPYTNFKDAMNEYRTKCRFTDDSVMTIALGKALLDANGNYDNLSELAIENMREFGGHKYPFAGYGGGFKAWLAMPTPIPYGSCGNGSAMRISAVPYFAKSLDEVKELSRKVTEVTHNHPEGLKGAEATACAIWLALNGYDKQTIKEYIEANYYKMNYSYEYLVLTYRSEGTCQMSVPQSLFAFFISDSYEETIRKAISMGGDADTMACIAGAVAAAYYGVPEDIEKEGMEYLTDELREIVLAVEKQGEKGIYKGGINANGNSEVDAYNKLKAQRLLYALREEGKLTDQMLRVFNDKYASNQLFTLDFKLLTDNQNDIFDHTGHSRYYPNNPIVINGTKYWICNHWTDGAKGWRDAFAESYGIDLEDTKYDHCFKR